ncbi:MAG TPA: bifunctional demethylmenaquinone methyltransferase/2-methoxy-6-polyprenyl-1,4-benzoquinol methylase UbiE [Candidatus Angelobacter sp.]|nr:bifunctional demethylmenaquinone methyltransferase/2-methoxy-6-polyprenyl-1,4-benzoquinol methylase UbiE [Candidatus Angelobacter sp.]
MARAARIFRTRAPEWASVNRVANSVDSPNGAIVSGTRPQGAHDEREAQRRVRDMFSNIAPRYDFLNHFLSGSFDKLWRRRTAKRFAHILHLPNARVLDLCCGTGDLLFALERQAENSRKEAQPAPRRFFGADFALPMLTLAQSKKKAADENCRVGFLAGDALALPFPDASFDLVTTAFGFRNLVNYERGLREIARVLRPGGELGILEFCAPKSGVLAALYKFYFTRILPKVGGAISGSGEAYSYLPQSVQNFPQPKILAEWLEAAGFENVQYERWTCGIVALHRGTKSS